MRSSCRCPTRSTSCCGGETPPASTARSTQVCWCRRAREWRGGSASASPSCGSRRRGSTHSQWTIAPESTWPAATSIGFGHRERSTAPTSSAVRAAPTSSRGLWNHAAMTNDASIEHRGGAALSREGSVLWIRSDRADERNSLDNDTIDELTALWAELQTDASVRAVVITGTGRDFCTGGSVAAGPPPSSLLD